MNKARQLTDERILELARKGRLREACGMLAEAYGAELVGACVSRLGDPTLAQDAAQDSLARAMMGLQAYRGSGGLRPWLHRIAANRCVDLLRSRSSLFRKHADSQVLDGLPAASEAMPLEVREEAKEQAARVKAVRDALSNVKEPDRSWVEMHYTHGVSYEDIAADAGLSRAAVKQRIWRATKRVRAALLAQGEIA